MTVIENSQGNLKSGKALPEIDLHLRALAVEAAASGIIITDRQGLIQWANPAFTRMTGYSLEELLGSSTNLLKSDLHPPKFYAQLWETILSGEVWQGEMTNRRKDGSLYIEEQTITPVRDVSGQVTHFIAIKQDISARRRAEQAVQKERQRFLNLLNEIPAVIYLRDANYQIRFFNQEFRNRFGDPADQPCYKIIRQSEKPCSDCPVLGKIPIGAKFAPNLEELAGRFYRGYHYLFQDVDGTDLILKISVDITESKQAEALFEENNRRLLELSVAERSQRQRAESLERAAQALGSSLDLDKVLDLILEQAQQALSYYAAAIFFLRGERVHMARHRGIELPESLSFLSEGFPINRFPLVQLNCVERQPVLIDDIPASTLWQPLPNLEWARSCASVPLISGDEVYGLIILLSDQLAFFDQDKLHLLGAFAAHAVQAIRNARLFAQVQLGSEHRQALSRRLVEVQENERRYVARELHDEASQALTSLMVQMGLLEREASSVEDLRAGIAELKGAVEQVMENLHRLAVDLRPSSLDYLGLVAALRQYTAGISQESGLSIQFESVGMDQRLPLETETALYRIVQEALSNVLRHAQATRADVLLERRGDHLVLIIEDNGIGLDVEAASRLGRLGLFGMQERASMLGGEFTVESSPGMGTTIYVEVPYGDSHITGG